MTSAVIAAAISLVVATGTVIVSYVTTKASLRRDHDRQEADFRQAMTTRLYDQRVATYPGLFKATDAFRHSRLEGAGDNLRNHLRGALGQVDGWHASEGGLLLSTPAYKALLELRNAVRRYIKEPPDSDHLEQLEHDIWYRKGILRAALRADLGLLFDEDREMTIDRIRDAEEGA